MQFLLHRTGWANYPLLTTRDHSLCCLTEVVGDFGFTCSGLSILWRLLLCFQKCNTNSGCRFCIMATVLASSLSEEITEHMEGWAAAKMVLKKAL